MGQGSSALAALQAEIVDAVTKNDPNRLYQLITVARQHALGQISVVNPNAPASPPSRSALGGLSALVSIKGRDGSTMSATQYLRSMITSTDAAAAPYHVMKDDGSLPSVSPIKPLKLPPPAIQAASSAAHVVESKEKSEPGGGGYQPPRLSAGAQAHDPQYQTRTMAPPTQQSPSVSPSLPADRGGGIGGFKSSTLPIDLNALYIAGETLVHHAAKDDKHEVLFLLVQAGADIHAVDTLGWTPLHSAAAAGSIRSARVCVGVGANPLAKSRLGLTPSQCTTHPEIKRELEKEEFARRDALEEQIRMMSANVTPKSDGNSMFTPIAGQNTMIGSSTLPPFEPGLYHVSCPVEVRAGDKLDILYRAPINHSSLDCFCLYYVEDERRPWLMRPRFGSTFYVPITPQQMVGGVYATITIIASVAKMPPATYRILYYDALSQTFPAASNAFKVIAQPSSAGFSMTQTPTSSWFDPSTWNTSTQAVDVTSSGATSTPIVLHAEFQTLSELTPLSLGSFLLPVPPYFLFNFVLNPLAVRMALELDPRLAQARDVLVPHRMKEKEFWQSYFYQMVALDFVQQDEEQTDEQADEQSQQEYEDNTPPQQEYAQYEHENTQTHEDANADGHEQTPSDAAQYDYSAEQANSQLPAGVYYDPYTQQPHPIESAFAATETPRHTEAYAATQDSVDATYYEQQQAADAYSATPEHNAHHNNEQQLATAQ